MEWHYCFRCRARLPLLEDTEFESVRHAYVTCVEAQRSLAERRGWNHAKIRTDDVFRPVVDEFERKTGYRMGSYRDVMHHHRSHFGPVCRACGKLLRTPRAKHCAACGASRYE